MAEEQVLKIQLKMQDVFYNNGITNIFWATAKAYSAEYEEKNNFLQIEIEKIKLILKPFVLEIEGNENDIKKWYCKIGAYLSNMGLLDINRLVYNKEKNIIEQGYFFGVQLEYNNVKQ